MGVGLRRRKGLCGGMEVVCGRRKKGFEKKKNGV